MLSHTTLTDTTQVSSQKVFGSEMGAEIDNGRYENSRYGCGESPLFGFA